MNSIALPQQQLLHSDEQSDAGHWQAGLALQFARTGAGTRLRRSRHHGPLYVQRPFYPEGSELAHVYLLHPPGGLVSGDNLTVELELQPDTAVLCTTPGAGRVYRAREDRRLQQQLNRLVVGANASLEWFPQEMIVYPGAVASMETRIELAPDAMFCGWEILSLGLPASGARFDCGSFTQRLALFRDGLPVLIEKLRLSGADLAMKQGTAGLQGREISGVFVAGPLDREQLAAFDMDALREAVKPAGDSLCVPTLLGDFIVVRYLGDCSARARSCFIAAWRMLRPVLLRREVCPPRIWAT